MIKKPLASSLEALAEMTIETVKAMATDEKAEVFNHPVVDYINTMLPNGAPVNSRHKFALKLANDLMILLDGDEARVKWSFRLKARQTDEVLEIRILLNLPDRLPV